MKRIFSIILLVSAMTLSLQAAGREKKPVEPFDRGIGRSSSVFIPAGTVGAGASFSYTNYSLGNGLNDTGYQMLFSLVQNLHGNLMSFGIAPQVSYFIRDNLAVGARFDYDRSSFGLGNLDLSLSDALSLSVGDFNYLKQAYTGALTLRNYIPFGQSKRFAMFTELRLTGGYGQSESYRMGYDETLEQPNKTGTDQDIYQFEIGVVPGICAFVTNEVAFEVSVGLMGFNYQKVVQVTNQVERSEMEKNGLNFKVNLLAINFGLSFYIPTGGHRMKKANN